MIVLHYGVNYIFYLRFVFIFILFLHLVKLLIDSLLVHFFAVNLDESLEIFEVGVIFWDLVLEGTFFILDEFDFRTLH